MLGELTLEEIDMLLSNNITGRIGCFDGAKVYIVPVSYAFNGTYLVAHSSEGMKIDIMRKHPQICFEVDEIQDPANWKSVILWGDYEEVTAPKERYYAMKFLVSKLTHSKTSETAGVREMTHEIEQTSIIENIKRIVYKIRIKEKTGRFEKN